YLCFHCVMRQANLSNNSMFTQDESYIKWKLFLEGDDQAYSWIYTHYIQVLYNYGLQITPDSEIVKDCIQDVFVKIYKAKKKLTVPQNPKVYLMIALKNNIYNTFNQERLQKNYAFSLYQTEEQLTVKNEFIDQEARHEEMNNIKRMMKILTPRQREVIYYRFIEELSYDDICQIMGLNYQSAYNLLQRSLQKIREAYGVTGIWMLILHQLTYLH
ncbi:RNA polymerase sigma factor, partial [Bacteroides thetaiotaomicron]|uniref:RNA polymerase sigma factor n=1 Tax=Bacteroides thetaiotaomicron TaxID=818 RepID=UPI0040634981